MKVTLNYREMLQAPDRPKLVQAMQSKIEGLKEILKSQLLGDISSCTQLVYRPYDTYPQPTPQLQDTTG